ncbi:hypothetical protein PGT21_033382 [Puccinia graminis f. sp. tritici]|uniref:Uncharacterized protein n=1 Tax=Puccinia graminis f. sp. tritici TaxID=56615 RepID=A0A5B0SMM7_PUCGR|nr:hypothetical protein PGT21_029799 [Puccinia graminis f. sp. tritici]KAA1081998.1 hypothetical protein PGTUg99_032127 [Puccinia graminis f. sp. tritici]KAA1087545.1 hypothetical protein PGT21_033382 [Puccinia graminis f. sp. tritici]KAA1138383.1 hypothetical protein PGTUg99_033620 [Puccinia graminis f. sp. tritici]
MKCFTLSVSIFMLLGVTCAMHIGHTTRIRAPTSDADTKLQECLFIWCVRDDTDHTSDVRPDKNVPT